MHNYAHWTLNTITVLWYLHCSMPSVAIHHPLWHGYGFWYGKEFLSILHTKFCVHTQKIENFRTECDMDRQFAGPKRSFKIKYLCVAVVVAQNSDRKLSAGKFNRCSAWKTFLFTQNRSQCGAVRITKINELVNWDSVAALFLFIFFRHGTLMAFYAIKHIQLSSLTIHWIIINTTTFFFYYESTMCCFFSLYLSSVFRLRFAIIATRVANKEIHWAWRDLTLCNHISNCAALSFQHWIYGVW